MFVSKKRRLDDSVWTVAVTLMTTTPYETNGVVQHGVLGHRATGNDLLFLGMCIVLLVALGRMGDWRLGRD